MLDLLLAALAVSFVLGLKGPFMLILTAITAICIYKGWRSELSE